MWVVSGVDRDKLFVPQRQARRRGQDIIGEEGRLKLGLAQFVGEAFRLLQVQRGVGVLQDAVDRVQLDPVFVQDGLDQRVKVVTINSFLNRQCLIGYQPIHHSGYDAYTGAVGNFQSSHTVMTCLGA